MSGATDIGCAIMYSVLFRALWIAVSPGIRAAGPAVDHQLVRRWPLLAALTITGTRSRGWHRARQREREGIEGDGCGHGAVRR
jgi:hypothetical protein